jgi:hypothetical protein
MNIKEFLSLVESERIKTLLEPLIGIAVKEWSLDPSECELEAIRRLLLRSETFPEPLHNAYSNHKWTDSVITDVECIRGAVHIHYEQKCLDCGSKRILEAFYRKSPDEEVVADYIPVRTLYAPLYDSSPCRARFDETRRTQRSPKKPKKLPADYVEIKCPVCGEVVFGPMHLEQYIKAELQRKHVEEQIEKNLDIIRRTAHARKDPNRLRFRLAIYRLYRHNGLAPKKIAELLNDKFGFSYSEAAIRNYIGEMFKTLCLKDSGCIFKPFFGDAR